MGIREDLQESWGDVDLLFLDEACYDRAILGVAVRPGGSYSVCYDVQKILEVLAEQMPWDDAFEFFSYNIEGAYVGEQSPTYLHRHFPDA